MQTEFGKIAQLLETVETGRTPLQENLDRVGSKLAHAAFAIVAVIVALGLWRGQPFLEMLIFGVALAVAVVPEALPAVVTISLAHRRAAHGQPPCAGPPLARRRDAGQHVRHLLGQDRHVDQGRNDGPPSVRGRSVAGRVRARATSRPVSSRRKARPWNRLRPCSNCCKRRRWRPTRIWCTAKPRAAGRSRAIRPKAPWSWPPPRPDCTRRSWMPAFPASTKSPSRPRPNA